MDITHLQPAAVWRNFAEICSIPHASGNEKELAGFLAEKAEKLGMTVRQDKFHNLRIDRKEMVPGGPRIILQGHLDMVPQTAPGKKFDFSCDPVTPVIRDDYIYADGTTLGADDGLGVALAFACLENTKIKANLSAVFTVSEETGLIGANALAPDFLEGDILINLDHGEERKVCIGCAGGVRVAFDFATGSASVPAGEAVKITLSGLPGGHSGACIHQKRGNALQMLARIIRDLPLAVAGFDGGTVDNAIPDSASVVAAGAAGELKEELLRRAEEIRKELDEPFTLELEITPADLPEKVWSPEFQQKFLQIFCDLPNGVAEFAPEYDVPRTSSNLASLKSSPGNLHLVFSARSLDDRKRKLHTGELISRLSELSPEVNINSEYPGWTPDPESKLPGLVVEMQKQINDLDVEIEVIHAGLEPGIFSGKNPRLEMISIGPDSFDIHTFSEHLSISSTRRFYAFLTAFLNRIA